VKVNWNKFIEDFQGRKLEQDVSCENGIGLCKTEIYAIKVYRCYWKNGWIDGSGNPIGEPFEVLCTPSFGADVEYQIWTISMIEEDGRITYSYYVRLDSCDSIVEKPKFPLLQQDSVPSINS
jgi:hypothetical protein